MNHIRWVAWGVIDVDGTMDRQQRRNYLRKLRAEFDTLNCKFDIGGSTKNPYYIIHRFVPNGVVKKQAYGGADALKKACAWLLLEVGDHERSEDGGVRGAGAEADT